MPDGAVRAKYVRPGSDAAVGLGAERCLRRVLEGVMAEYDFRSLNDKEFESVAVELLSAEHGVRIERFKPGKDGGVDGRWFRSPGAEIVVQCKHWVGTGYKGLVRHLETAERPKLD